MALPSEDTRSDAGEFSCRIRSALKRILVPAGGALCLLLVLAAGVFQLYPPIGWVDPGLYIRWFLTPTENMAFHGGNYHGARLGFVLPGALLYALTDPMTAQVLLVGGFCLLGFAGIYKMAAGCLRSVPARLTVALLCSLNPLWMAAFLRGYVDGPGIAFGLLSLAFLLRNDRPPRRLDAAFSGALALLSFAAHPFAGGLVAASIAFVLALRSPSRVACVISAMALMLGAVIAMVILGSASVWLGMPFFFFDMTDTVSRAFIGSGSSFDVPLAAWLPMSPRVLVLPLTLVLSLAGLRMALTGERDRLGVALSAAALVPLAIYISLLLLAGSTLPLAGFYLMQHPFYASYLWLSLVPALIAFLRGLERSGCLLDRRTALGLLGGLLGIMVLAGHLSIAARDLWFSSWPCWLVAAASALLALLFIARYPGRSAFVFFAFIVSLIGAFNRDTAPVFLLADGANNAAQHRALAAFQRFLGAYGVTHDRYLLWFNRDQFTTVRNLPSASLYALTFQGKLIQMNMLDSLAASIGWDRATLGFAMPSLTPYGERQLARLTRAPQPLVTLCAEPSECELGFKTLEDMGLSVVRLASHTIDESGSIAFVVALAQVTAPEPDALPSEAIVRRTVAKLLRAGPNGALVEQSGITVTQISDLSCSGTSLSTLCSFAFTLSTKDVAHQNLRFRRLGPLWIHAP